MMKGREIMWLLVRYLVLVALGLFNLWIFYLVFTPLTVYPVFRILSVIYPGAQLFLEGNVINLANNIQVQIIPACVAGAAYYLLLILNLSTPMRIKKRVKSLGFLFGSFLVLNILRILIFAGLVAKNFQYFDVTHVLVWHFGSTLLLVLIWFANVWIFNIREIPVYTDIRLIIKDIKPKKSRR